MAGMVDSFNISVAAGITLHHAVQDRIKRRVTVVLDDFFLKVFDPFSSSAFTLFIAGVSWRYI